MVEIIQRKISESRTARWVVLLMVSLTMMSGYFLLNVMVPLKELLVDIFGWSNTDYGVFYSGYGWFNIFLLMLIFGGLFLDKVGSRITGVISVGIMLVGISVKYYAIGFMDPGQMVDFWFFGHVTMKLQVLSASLGFALFAVGYEVVGITATKIIVRWFKGKEVALALGMNIAFARMGTFLALIIPVPIVNAFGGSISMPILFGMLLLVVGFLTFLVYIVMDRKLDKEKVTSEMINDQDRFRVRDIFSLFRIRGFWYIAILCLLFYASVLPFIKFSVDFIVQKFGTTGEYSSLIPSLLPIGTLLLTPLFGIVYDRRGKGASMMIIGALMLVFVYVGFSIPWLDHWSIAVLLVTVLGVAFSLVPSAMWPSVPKIIPDQYLGTAYALVFWVQNWGLAGVPLLIGWSLDRWGALPSENINGVDVHHYDYTVPMLIFLGLGLLAVLFGFLLKNEDKRCGYGLQKPNISK